MARSIPSVRYAIYTRQSAEPRDGLSSCEAQFQVCLELARSEARPGEEWIGERFDDEGVSGRTLDRPALNRLRERVRAGDNNRVYAVALDRYSRTVTDTVQLLDEFERAGVEVHVAHQPELCSAPENRLLRHILASFAQFEREIIAARIAETRAYLKRHGRRLAGPAPYGYDADPIHKQLVPNRVEARRVRAIFKRAACGQSPAEIARRIDHLRWRTKQWVSQRSSRTVGSGRWTARQVRAVLRNPVYRGRFADGGSTRPGTHPAIVDPQVFEAVQAVLDSRRPAPTRLRVLSIRFPLRGKVVCPQCRRRLCTYTVTRRLGPGAAVAYRYYRCRSTAGGRAPCRGVQYPAGKLEAAVRKALGQAETWRVLRTAEAPDAEAIRRVWSALDVLAQDRLAAGMIDRIEFRRRNSEMRITFKRDVSEALSLIFKG
jgi:site-specific DNA recombinase